MIDVSQTVRQDAPVNESAPQTNKQEAAANDVPARDSSSNRKRVYRNPAYSLAGAACWYRDRLK